ncbi:putative olfactory receptor 2W6 [Heteronotia binoei]|uniref:putative olfactory receptor 2W6 n=1 Tax=Heteronotia binoei TaxID=13085 RepID=UPI00292F5636|nr:putative olfactory receptor 2W6 [Heteronotia binoei]
MRTENITSVTQFILVGLSNHRKTQILLFVVILLVYLLTIVGNLVIIMLIHMDSHLHTPMYYFLTHLSSLEICYVTSTVPQMLTHLLIGNGAISFTRCAAQMYIALSLGSTEGLLLGAMAYDRYLAICHPLVYVIAMGRWRQLQLVFASWAGGFLLSIMNVGCTLRLPFCGPNHINHFFCELPVVLKLACADTHVTEALLRKNLTSVKEFTLLGFTYHRKMQVLLFVVILVIYSLTLVGNGMVIVLVRADFRLHTPMYFFLTHLAGLEICYVTSTLPQALFNLLSGNRTISFIGCAVQMHLILTLGGTECVLLSAMAYDRYLAICHPLLYAIVMDRWRQLQLASFCWGVGILLATINVSCTFHHPFCGSSHVNHFVCELPAVLKLACAETRITEKVVFGTAALILLGPLSVILTSYGLILSSVLKMRTTAGRRKAFSTCASHLIVVTVFYGTVITMYMRPGLGSGSDLDKKIAIFYIVVTPLLNPIIYTLRNKDVHGAVVKVLRRRDFGEKG